MKDIILNDTNYNKQEVYDELISVLGKDNVIVDKDMSGEVTFRAGGSADIFVMPEDISKLQEVLHIVKKNNVKYLILGNGSNLLIKDSGYRGVIIKIKNNISESTFNKIEMLSSMAKVGEIRDEKYVYVKVGAGVLMSTFANFLYENELTGFEFASGIPGTIGGAVFMNAGAYGSEIRDCIVSCEVLSNKNGDIKVLSNDELELGYRTSILKFSKDIVCTATFRFEKGDKVAIKSRMDELKTQRNAKQPVNYPSAGSFFKRPKGYFAGKLVQDAGLKGRHVGDAEVSTLHSGFIINKGNATATDIIDLMHICQEEVFAKFGVKLEPEIQIIGEDEQSNISLIALSKKPKYKMLFDWHTHTVFSHGKGTIEENVEMARKKGLKSIAITDHGYGHITYGVKKEKVKEMRDRIDKLNAKYDDIEVYLGIEANILEKGQDGNYLDMTYDDIKEYDFINAGYHYGVKKAHCIDNFLFSHGWKKRKKGKLIKQNTEMIINALEKNDIRILTHPGDKAPVDILAIAKACSKTDTIMEINTHHTHLTPEEIKIVANENVKFIISSDAHMVEDIANFEEGLLRAYEAKLDVDRIVNIVKI